MIIQGIWNHNIGHYLGPYIALFTCSEQVKVGILQCVWILPMGNSLDKVPPPAPAK